GRHVGELAEVGAGVHDQAAADRARDAAEELEAAELPRRRAGEELAGRDPGLDPHPALADAGEAAQAARRQDDAAHAAVADEEVRAAADRRERQAAGDRDLDEGDDLVERRRRGERVGGAADLEGRVPGERLVEADAGAEDLGERDAILVREDARHASPPGEVLEDRRLAAGLERLDELVARELDVARAEGDDEVAGLEPG